MATQNENGPLESQEIVNKARTMITENYAGICILIPDANPEERKSWLRQALNAALRWNITNPDKRSDDEHHAIVLSDLLAELMKSN